MSEDHRATLEQANAAVSAGDHEGFLRLCTDDTRWHFVGDRVLDGKDAVRQWMATTYRTPPEFQVDEMIAEGDRVVALGDITVRDEDGKATRSRYCDVWRFRDGRMAELQAFVVEAKDG